MSAQSKAHVIPARAEFDRKLKRLKLALVSKDQFRQFFRQHGFILVIFLIVDENFTARVFAPLRITRKNDRPGDFIRSIPDYE